MSKDQRGQILLRQLADNREFPTRGAALQYNGESSIYENSD
jgi:hypothetical protein